jgi:hypothetical protein
MARVEVSVPVKDLIPCNCGGGTWLKKEETTIYHSRGLTEPTVTTRYAIFCDSCSSEVTSNRLDLAVSIWNKEMKARERW